MSSSSTGLVRPIAFGGCNLHNPLIHAAQDGRIDLRYRNAITGRNWLLTLSPREMMQAYELAIGTKTLSPELQRLYIGEERSFAPSPDAADILAECEMTLIEVSTPYELVYRELVFNVNRLGEFFAEYCGATGFPKRDFEAWRTALLKQQPERAAELGAALKASLPRPDWEGIDLADLIDNLRCNPLGVDETAELLGEFIARVGKPAGMIIHNFRFMPDGRAISWPADFKRNSVEVAQRLGLPMLDLADFVVEQGATRIVGDDGRHWHPETGMALVGGRIAEFAASVVGKTAPAPVAAPSEEPAPAPAAAAVTTASPGRIPDYAFDRASSSYFPFREDVLPMVLVLGDSWALGENGDPEDRPVTDMPEHPDHALMFASGPAPQDRLMGGFKSLHETLGARRRETPCSGIADVMMSDCVQRFGTKPRMLFSAVGYPAAMLVPSEGGQQTFTRGSDSHGKAMNLVSSARHLAAREGRELQILAICFAQSRNREPPDGLSRAYWSALLKLRFQYAEDLAAITGQRQAIPLLVPQHGRGATRIAKFPSTALAQLAAADTDPLVRCIGPVYHLDAEHSGDGNAWRWSSDGTRRLGRQFGRFIMDDILGPGLEPLRATSCRLAGPRRIHLNYARDLAIDTSSIDVAELGPGLGIDFVDGPKPSARIVSVTIPEDRPKRLEIELDVEPCGRPASLYVAARTTGGGGIGRLTGTRCAIRAAAPAIADPGSNRPMFDWACTEVVPIG